jgi:hypothetical protein
MNNIIETKKSGVILLTLAMTSILGIKASHATFDVYCPAFLNEKSRQSVTHQTEYAYHGDTTGDKRILVETTHNEYGHKLEQPYKFMGASGGATGALICKYQYAEPNSGLNRELHGKAESNVCQVIKPESGDITTQNNYFKCD